MNLKPIPELPDLINQPEVVKALDYVRWKFNDENHVEFYWFAREYPRVYRYHLYHAAYRLRAIHEVYKSFHVYSAERLASLDENFLGFGRGRGDTLQVYWDFEAYLNALNAALDVLSRVVGLFYAGNPPISFNRLCAKNDLFGAVEILRAAQGRWVARMKDYRDCFVHYTPVDNETAMYCFRYLDGWEVRAKLPVNPNVRENLGFRYSRRTELLRYAIATYKNMRALDRKVGMEVRRAYRAGKFPARTEHLFFLGRRQG